MGTRRLKLSVRCLKPPEECGGAALPTRGRTHLHSMVLRASSGRTCRCSAKLVARLDARGRAALSRGVMTSIKRDARNCSRQRSASTLPTRLSAACFRFVGELHLTKAAGLGASQELRWRAGSSGGNRHAASESVDGVPEATRRVRGTQRCRRKVRRICVRLRWSFI